MRAREPELDRRSQTFSDPVGTCATTSRTLAEGNCPRFVPAEKLSHEGVAGPLRVLDVVRVGVHRQPAEAGSTRVAPPNV